MQQNFGLNLGFEKPHQRSPDMPVLGACLLWGAASKKRLLRAAVRISGAGKCLQSEGIMLIITGNGT